MRLFGNATRQVFTSGWHPGCTSRFNALGALLLLALVPTPHAGTAPSQLVIEGDRTVGTRTAIRLNLLNLGVGTTASEASVYVPLGYTLDLSAPPGTTVGAGVGLGTTLVVVDPMLHLYSPCAQARHDALWRLALDALAVPGPPDALIAIDRASGLETAFASYRLRVCLHPTEAFPGSLSMRPDVLTEPTSPGDYVWRAVFAPLSGPSTESRVLVRLPVEVRLRAKRITRKQGGRTLRKVLLSGQILENATPAPLVSVNLERAPSVEEFRRPPPNKINYLGSAMAGKRGFSVEVRDRRGRFYRGRTWWNWNYSRPALRGLCRPPSLAVGGCTSASSWIFIASSAIVEARP